MFFGEPSPDLIDYLKLPDGTILPGANSINGSSSEFRRIVGIYDYPDGRQAYVGVSLEGCTRYGFVLGGRPGTGKTETALQMVLQHLGRHVHEQAQVQPTSQAQIAEASHSPGVVLLGVEETATEKFLRQLTPEQERLVIWLDPVDPERVAGFNLLKATGREARLITYPEFFGDFLPTQYKRKKWQDSLPAQVQFECKQLLELAEQPDGLDFLKDLSTCRQYLLTASRLLELLFSRVNQFHNPDQRLRQTDEIQPAAITTLLYALQAVLETETSPTLLTLCQFLTDESFRHNVLSRTVTRTISNFFTSASAPASVPPKQAEGAGSGNFETAAGIAGALSLLKCLGVELPLPAIAASTSSWFSNMFCQKRTTINLASVLGQSKIICFNSDNTRDKAGAKAASFLHALNWRLIQEATENRRWPIIESWQKPVVMVMDEFYNIFANNEEALSSFLEKTHRYNVAPILTYQLTDQLGVCKRTLFYCPLNIGVYNLGTDDYKEFLREICHLSEASQPAHSYQQLVAYLSNLPAHTQLVRLFDNQRSYPPVMLRSLPLVDGAALTTRAIPISTQISSASGSESGARLGIVESLTARFYATGQLNWKLALFSLTEPSVEVEVQEEAEAGGAIDQQLLLQLTEVNATAPLLRKYQELLLKIESLTYAERTALLIQLAEEDWLLYRASRYGRDLALLELIQAQPTLIAVTKERVRTLSNLRYATPLYEIEAERLREPGSFS